jgi:hypothetical protein
MINNDDRYENTPNALSASNHWPYTQQRQQEQQQEGNERGVIEERH